ncbi:hypothetical protein [Sinomonas sp. G460-2]|uniref:hypothetical protein n=1 Tax=Sinomonas sp. G460-2 TaxID=3393464 RepID=UPI0039F11528
MRTRRPQFPRKNLLPVAALALVLAGCAQPTAHGGPTPSSSSSGSGNPACDLITPGIVAARIGPGLSRVGQQMPAKPPGSRDYECAYSSKTGSGLTGFTVVFASPASAEDIAQVKKTPDCAQVTGIGDFACLQWTGYFGGGDPHTSANAVLMAVRGDETLQLHYVAPGPLLPGSAAPDGNTMAHAVAAAAVDAGWGNGSALSVPPAPPVGAPLTGDNPLCALVSADAVKHAFGATVQGHSTSDSVDCRYTFGDPGVPGPDSLIFTAEFQKGGAASLPDSAFTHGQRIDGVGDRAVLFTSSVPAGPKSGRPAGDVPITILSIMVVRGQNLATFTVEVLISPTGPSLEQTRDEFISLVRGIDF